MLDTIARVLGYLVLVGGAVLLTGVGLTVLAVARGWGASVIIDSAHWTPPAYRRPPARASRG